jgi:hypothetical protein
MLVTESDTDVFEDVSDEVSDAVLVVDVAVADWLEESADAVTADIGTEASDVFCARLVPCRTSLLSTGLKPELSCTG